MSNSQAIAAVTATLQYILQHSIPLDPDLNDTQVSILPLDKARGTNTFNQLNLFLYMVVRNAAWANADMPRQVKPGESAISPMPLNLYYLVTAFGRDDDAAQPFGHELLGKAMSILNDFPLLSADEIRTAVQAQLPNSDLDQQLERIRITFHPLSLDELSKLWTGFAMQYRLSAAYEVGVTLIESTRPTRAPLPVLTRGPGDSGFLAQADPTPPVPTLFSTTPPLNQASAQLNDIVSLVGVHLDGSNIGVQFNHALWMAPVEVAPQPNPGSTAISVQIPNDAVNWPAGFYTLAVLVQRPGENFRRSTNQLALALAPTITITPATAAAGAIVYTVNVSPEIWPRQRASLLLNENEFIAAPIAANAASLPFPTADLPPGLYLARLRVDGVESQLVDRTKTPPVFKPSQQVTVT